MSIICRICFAMSLIVCTLLSNASFGQVAPRFEPLHLGEVMPEGWLQTVLERDLKSGYAGHLDELLQDPNSGEFLLRPENNDYVTRAKNRDCRHDDAGLSIPPKPRSWWHAEMIGDWHDSLIRAAFLAGEPTASPKPSSFCRWAPRFSAERASQCWRTRQLS